MSGEPDKVWTRRECPCGNTTSFAVHQKVGRMSGGEHLYGGLRVVCTKCGRFEELSLDMKFMSSDNEGFKNATSPADRARVRGVRSMDPETRAYWRTLGWGSPEQLAFERLNRVEKLAAT